MASAVCFNLDHSKNLSSGNELCLSISRPLPFLKQQILHSFKLKDFADEYFKFDENGRKYSKWVENIVGKGEIAHYEQFHLLPLCFLKRLVLQTRKN